MSEILTGEDEFFVDSSAAYSGNLESSNLAGTLLSWGSSQNSGGFRGSLWQRNG
jgi:hypothetical protein